MLEVFSAGSTASMAEFNHDRALSWCDRLFTPPPLFQPASPTGRSDKQRVLKLAVRVSITRFAVPPTLRED